MDISSKRIVFVTGKGGVGKSFTAATIAFREARKGRRVCLVELGSRSFYESYFETRGIGYEPVEIFQNLHVALLTPEDSIREYVTYYLKVSKLYDLIFQNKVARTFMNAVPGLNEMAILGKLTSDIRHVGPQSEYDLYVVDCYSTGHALALFRASKGISEIVKVGPVSEQTRAMSDILKTPTLVSYVLVTLAEEMPINETFELHKALKEEFGAESTIILNRLLQPPVSPDEIGDLIRNNKLPEGMGDFVKYLTFKIEKQKQAYKVLKDRMHEETLAIPLIFPRGQSSMSTEDKLAVAADYLEKKWELTSS